MGVNSLPKTVTRQSRDCDLEPGPHAKPFGSNTIIYVYLQFISLNTKNGVKNVINAKQRAYRRRLVVLPLC